MFPFRAMSLFAYLNALFDRVYELNPAAVGEDNETLSPDMNE